MPSKIQALPRILRRQEVERLTGMSRSFIYEQMNVGDFPRSVQISVKAVGWLEHEVEEWIASRARVQKHSSSGHAQSDSPRQLDAESIKRRSYR